MHLAMKGAVRGMIWTMEPLIAPSPVACAQPGHRTGCWKMGTVTGDGDDG